MWLGFKEASCESHCAQLAPSALEPHTSVQVHSKALRLQEEKGPGKGTSDKRFRLVLLDWGEGINGDLSQVLPDKEPVGRTCREGGERGETYRHTLKSCSSAIMQ